MVVAINHAGQYNVKIVCSILDCCSEAYIHKNLADKRKEIQACFGSLERDLSGPAITYQPSWVIGGKNAIIWCLS